MSRRLLILALFAVLLVVAHLHRYRPIELENASVTGSSLTMLYVWDRWRHRLCVDGVAREQRQGEEDLRLHRFRCFSREVRGRIGQNLERAQGQPSCRTRSSARSGSPQKPTPATRQGRRAVYLAPLRIMQQLEWLEERINCVLHDIMEDSPWTAGDLRRKGFSEPVVQGVLAVTRRAGEPYLEFVERAARPIRSAAG